MKLNKIPLIAGLLALISGVAWSAAQHYYKLNNGVALQWQPSNIVEAAGTGLPEGVYKAPPGSGFRSTNGGLYQKISGTGNTGWHSVNGCYVSERTFTETTGAGVYTASVAIPAGATITDIIINGVALWTATTSATLKVGDVAVDDGYYTAVNLKATDLLAGESLSFALAGGKAGSYIANSQVSPRYSASARTISGIVTTVGAAGATGLTRMSVYWSLPNSTTAATKV